MPSTTFLVDTNVLRALARKEPDPGVLQWAHGVGRVAISVVTAEEVYVGLSWRPSPRIRLWFEGFLETHCEVLPVTAGIAKWSGELRGQLQARGEARTDADVTIAATALAQQLTLVTRSVRDFEGYGALLLDPFRE